MLLLAYAAVYLIWGTSYLAIRIAVGSIPPLLMMGVRCIAAGTLLLAWATLRGDRPSWRSWGHAAVAGAPMFGVCYAGVAWAEQRLPSGLTALLAATTPLWLVVLEWPGGRRPAIGQLAGLVVGVAGVGLLVAGPGSTAFHLAPMLAVMLGTVAWAAGSLYARRRMPASFALSGGMLHLVGGGLLLPLSWAAHEFGHGHVVAASATSVAALVYLVIFGSLVAFCAYFWLLRIAPAWKVGTYAYVNPLIAVALGATLAGERITGTLALAALVIAASVALVVLSQGSALHAQETSGRSRDSRPRPRAAVYQHEMERAYDTAGVRPVTDGPHESSK